MNRRALGAVLLMLATGPARAQPTDEAARTRAAALQAEGHRLLNGGDAQGALDRFESAYQLVPSPKILFNMGRAYEKVGDAINTYECFDRFLAEARDVPPESRAVAERSRAAARARVALVELVAPAGAELMVDGRAMGRTPLVRPLALAPGTRVFRLERDDKLLSEKAVPVAAGAITRFVIDAPVISPLPPGLAPATSPAVATPPARPGVAAPAPAREGEPPLPIYRRWWFWAAVVAGAAVTGVVATGALSRRDAACPREWQCP